ncbi:MAG: hypothetical protein RJB14_2934 [Pseudomonadota bacterium]
MTITPIDLSPRADNASKMNALDNLHEPASGPSGQGFSQVMNQLLHDRAEPENWDATQEKSQTEPGGQEMAAESQEATSGQDLSQLFNLHHPELGSWSLKAVNLGPTLNVITPDQAAPDAQSLEAFARSQGLDENAVQWLMGTPLDSSASGMQPTANSAILSPHAAVVSTSQNVAVNLNMGSPVQTLASSTGLPTGSNPGLAETAAEANPNVPATPAPSGFMPGAALWAMTWSGETSPAKTIPTSANESDNAQAAALQIQLMRQPAPAAVWMLRNAMPQEVKAERANTMPLLSESELDLSADLNPELLDSLLSDLENTPAPASQSHSAHSVAWAGHRPETQPALLSDPASSEAAENTGAQAAQRSENIQNLAEKMGQAVGQRMLTEIEKGQWHLKLQLRPATLGHIEVEMRMLSGELDAVFNAPQALTRELLQEGMSRLKDTLNQMGMDVASMQVKDGQTRQNGGKSTPNQASKSTDLVNNDSKSTNSPIITVARQKMGEDGWDVLV